MSAKLKSSAEARMKRFNREAQQDGGGVAMAVVDSDLEEELREVEEELVSTRERLLDVEAQLREERSARQKIGDALTARLVERHAGAAGAQAGEVAALATQLEREQETNDSLNQQLAAAWRRNHALTAMVGDLTKSRWRRLRRRAG